MTYSSDSNRNSSHNDNVTPTMKDACFQRIKIADIAREENSQTSYKRKTASGSQRCLFELKSDVWNPWNTHEQILLLFKLLIGLAFKFCSDIISLMSMGLSLMSNCQNSLRRLSNRQFFKFMYLSLQKSFS